MRIDAKFLHVLVSYEPESGIFVWRKRSEELFAVGRWGSRKERADIWNSQHAGTPAFSTLNKAGYMVGSIFKCQIKAHRAAWAITYGSWPEGQIDHINGIKTDNRIQNLRVVDSLENARNSSMPYTNKSGFVGVYFHSRKKLWCAHIYDRCKHIHIGSFKEKADAVAARKLEESRIGFHKNHGRSKNITQ